ncbi:MAG: DUF2061 domain-containing protein [Candidatus Thorarchaeota archaeon]
MKLKDKLIKQKEVFKESFIKSLIYRVITITLGMLVALIVTGSLTIALSVGVVTEIVQFINYFIYESIWTNFHDKRLRKKIEELKEINLKFDFDLIKEISYEFSQTETFIEDIYESILRFYDKLLSNQYVDEIREDILRDKKYFEKKHEKRSFN